VLDTNIVLDVFVFNDPASQPLKQALQSGQASWLATQDMRMELARVLGYPLISKRLETLQLSAANVLAQFDRYARLTAVADRAAVRCADTDDQKFIDLAVTHRATLLSKDQAVLRLRKRLQALGVSVRRGIDSTQGR
jgi:putative PIN family toxin of toxin-antitoxin system